MLSRSSLADWSRRLRMIAAAADEDIEQGLAPAFLAWRRGERMADGLPAARGGDDALWRAAIDPSISNAAVDRLISHEGPLFPQADGDAIEVWTERELSGIHALSRLASRRNAPPWATRAESAALWHVEHTQPDNATNRPWALHVFLTLADRENAPDAALYAETLLHNALVVSGRPDPLSAQILLDAAEALDSPDGG